MSAEMAHRGPDDSGFWFDEEAGVGLAHRRLAILDTSVRGRQPFASRDSRFQLVHNGEIFNYAELRTELSRAGHRFETRTDTEVMVAAFVEWGVEHAVRRFNGQFAFALWDASNRVVHLCRDRFGQKPLYYLHSPRCFAAVSDLRALDPLPAFDGAVDRTSLALYLRRHYVPAPYSIFADVLKVMPGEIVTHHVGRAAELTKTRYWSAVSVATRGLSAPSPADDQEAVTALHAEIRKAVARRLVSDRPVGAFLSGGIDSSLITAVMQEQSGAPVKTFTVAFDDGPFDESKHAQEVARHLGTDHHEILMATSDVLRVVEQMPRFYDEPFSDASQVPTCLLTTWARRHVTVCLSGDGADECFGGYRRYRIAHDLWSRLGVLPSGLRRWLAYRIRTTRPETLDRYLGWAGRYARGYGRRGSVGQKLHRFSTVLDAPDRLAMYAQLLSSWRDPAEVLLQGGDAVTPILDLEDIGAMVEFCDQMQAVDTVSYLPDDILVKLDRASMGVGLEARSPFLDHELFALAWRLPQRRSGRNAGPKWLLRQVLGRYLPPRVFERPKVGFGAPMAAWLRGPLREWAEELLSPGRLRAEGFFRVEAARAIWLEHVSGRRDWYDRVWNLLMFQAWLEHRGSRRAAAASIGGSR